ncbi:hypothetical protein VPHF86_0132 [Vibrio phage F86]
MTIKNIEAIEYIHECLRTRMYKPQLHVEAMKRSGMDIVLRKNTPYTIALVNHEKESACSYYTRDVKRICTIITEPRDIMARTIIEKRREYAEYMKKTAIDFEYDVAEPAVAIIQKMITKPHRFHIERTIDPHLCYNENNCTTILIDKDTKVKFITKMPPGHRYVHDVILPSVFNSQENEVISSLIAKIVRDTANERHEKELARKAKRIAKHRAELMTQYGVE